jgi:hypothetical protein
MTDQQQANQQNPEQQEQQLQNYQSKLLEQYSQLIEQQHYEAAQQMLNDSLQAYEALGVKRALTRFKQDSQQLLQEKLQGLTEQHSQQIVERRAQLPDVEAEDDDPGLELPSLQENIDRAHQNYGVITGSHDQAELPDDLQASLDA